MRFFLLFILLFSVSSNSFGQHNFGFKIDIGTSKMYKNSDTKPALSGNLGFFYIKSLNTKHFIKTEFLLSQIENRFYSDVTDEYGKLVENGYFKGYHHTSFITLPITYGMNFNKLSVSLGFQNSFAFRHSWNFKEEVENSDGDLVTKIFKGKEDAPFFYDFGSKSNLSFKLNEKVNLTSNLFFSLKNITKQDFLLIRQFTIGVEYSFQ